jgi:hypothetical protein
VMFQNLMDATEAVLGEAVLLAHRSTFPFAVIGGWSPFLLNSGPILHPGTRDVDLLFSRGKEIGALGDVLKAFISAGYAPSAKHPFQVIRILNIENQRVAFNVDFLHPDERGKSAEMFVDHQELDLWLDDRQRGKLLIKSVVTPVSQFIFDGHIEILRREVKLPDGSTREVGIPVMDELGTLVTKADSVKSPKRQRDALDIFIAIAQARDLSKLASDARRLEKSHPQAFLSLENLRAQVQGEKTEFWRNFEWCQREWDLRGVTLDEAKTSVLSLLDEAGVRYSDPSPESASH